MYNLHLCNLHLFFSRKKPGPTEEEARREGHQGVPDKDFVSLKNSEKKIEERKHNKRYIHLFIPFYCFGHFLFISYSFRHPEIEYTNSTFDSANPGAALGHERDGRGDEKSTARLDVSIRCID